MARPCAFLENGECSIYPDRPLICREYVVTTPAEHCSHLSVNDINRVEPPVALSDGFAAVTAAVEKRAFEQVPLFAALAWADRVENAEPVAHHSGVDLLKVLARWIDSNSGKPLDARDPS
jgi:Fe-S-cluster containining protein